jgi:diketogulonate reductase-like aldo/keto reductase
VPACGSGALGLRHPEAGTPEHVRENRAALDLRLTRQDLAELERAFPRPEEKQPLAML